MSSISMTTLQIQGHYLHFTDRKVETQGVSVACPSLELVTSRLGTGTHRMWSWRSCLPPLHAMLLTQRPALGFGKTIITVSLSSQGCVMMSRPYLHVPETVKKWKWRDAGLCTSSGEDTGPMTKMAVECSHPPWYTSLLRCWTPGHLI